MLSGTGVGLRQWLRDMGLGLCIFSLFVALSLTLGHSDKAWTVTGAQAAEVIASRAVEVSAPAGPVAENAIVAAAQMRPASDPLMMRRLAASTVLALSFSLLVAFNLAFWRHLKSVGQPSRHQD